MRGPRALGRGSPAPKDGSEAHQTRRSPRCCDRPGPRYWLRNLCASLRPYSFRSLPCSLQASPNADPGAPTPLDWLCAAGQVCDAFLAACYPARGADVVIRRAARTAAAATRALLSDSSATTSSMRSSIRCLAATLQAISRTRQWSSHSAWRTDVVRGPLQRSPRTAQTRSQYCWSMGTPVASSRRAGAPPSTTTNSGSTSAPDNSAAHRATTSSRPNRSHAPATRSFGVALNISEGYEEVEHARSCRGRICVLFSSEGRTRARYGAPASLALDDAAGKR